MKKFISSSFQFAIFASFFYFVSLFIWTLIVPSILKPNVNYKIGGAGHLFSRLSEVKNQKNLDILFLGSSGAYRGFDTRIFTNSGYKCFNLGSSSQTPIQTDVLLYRYLENLNPKIVIYEVNPVVFMLDGVESSLDIIANDRYDKYSLDMVLKINHIKTYNTYMYGLIASLFNLNKSFSEPAVKGLDTYVSGGFVERELDYNNKPPHLSREISLNQNQLESFTDIMSRLKDKGIDVKLVFLPIPSSSYKSYTNIAYFDSLMSTYSIYYNFNEFMSLNDSLDFLDADHLNQNGVRLMNAELIEILNQE